MPFSIYLSSSSSSSSVVMTDVRNKTEISVDCFVYDDGGILNLIHIHHFFCFDHGHLILYLRFV
ncbi:hypothetical protein DERF_006620 [Dermatophagoides farinae]|uniref:Uncharacterized protein n=1 Tax=Dermatophagoides farinae TaxID=6954 RepID=A0A922L2S6_DERFA|nr:hypothetical protein DERF_006620 [Dermatophagoides farinae]